MKAPGYQIKIARYAIGISIKEAAEGIGISPKTLSDAEKSGKVRVSTWKKIKSFYGLELQDENYKAVSPDNFL